MEQAALETRPQLVLLKEITAGPEVPTFQHIPIAVEAAEQVRLEARLLAAEPEMVVTAQRQLFLDRQSLMLAAAVAAQIAEAKLALPAAQVAEARALKVLLPAQLQEQQILAEEGVEMVETVRLMRPQAALASSSFPTLYPSETQSSLSPQPHGLLPRARPRWTIWLLRVVVVAVETAAVAAVLVASVLEPRYLLQREQLMS